MNKKVLIYVVVALAVIVAGFAVVMYKQKAAGLATGTPAGMSQEKSSSAELESDIEAKGGRGRRYVEDAG